MPPELWRDGDSENLSEKYRSGHTGNGAEGIDRALKFSLRGRINVTGHQGLHSGSRGSS
jgi:hypothetical protein